MLGLNGLVVKCHGSSKSKEIRIAVGQCITFKREDVTARSKHILLRNHRPMRRCGLGCTFNKEGGDRQLWNLKKSESLSLRF